jgi:hypothetical protein
LKKLIVNIFIFSLPLLISITIFIIGDPFSVIYRTDGIAEKSDDVLKVKEYLGDPNTYNSFVFGNSRGEAFTELNWKRHIGEGNKLFLFNAPGEALLNISKKIELIKKNGGKLDHAIVIVDDGILENTDNEKKFYRGPVYNHHPKTSYVSYLDFYFNYVKYYFNDLFFAKYISYLVTKKYQNWMQTAFKDPKPGSTCDIDRETVINTDFAEYKKLFSPDYSNSFNPQKVTKKIDERDLEHLRKIKALLTEGKADFSVILPPDFHRQKVQPEVLRELRNIFQERLFDFTGVNKFTLDSTLHYENLHFTKKAAAMMLDSVYNH